MSIIFITGATSGIGRATARVFAGAGWRVIAAARRTERLESLRGEYPDKVLVRTLDVRDADAVARVFDELPEEWRGIDVLVNNAGLALGMALAQNCDPADWDTMIDTNIKGLLNCTRAVLPRMTASKHGHIVNIGSVAGSYAYTGGNVYGATKAFVEQFSRNMRCDVHGTWVRVTNIEPGLLETEFTLVRMKGDQSASDALYRDCEPLHPEDIAECIRWAVMMPKHVNINNIEVMPVCQSLGATEVFRE